MLSIASHAAVLLSLILTARRSDMPPFVSRSSSDSSVRLYWKSFTALLGSASMTGAILKTIRHHRGRRLDLVDIRELMFSIPDPKPEV